jgi:hypothetical protein
MTKQWLSRPAQLVTPMALLTGVIGSIYAQEQVYTPLPQREIEPSLEERFFKWGPFEIRPSAAASVTYDDNLELDASGEIDDFIWTFSPSVTVGTGAYRSRDETYLSLDYTPSLLIYTDHDQYNALDHNLNAFGQWKGSKLTLGLGQSYLALSGGLIEASDREERDLYVTLLRTKYDMSDKTSFEVNGRMTISDYESFNSYNEWLNENWFNYHWTEKVTVGAGATFGWRDVKGDRNPNETLQQGLVRAIYTVTEKVYLNASAGAEFRQFQGGEDEGPAFVFSLAATYRPLERTFLTLEAYSQENVSLVSRGQKFTATGVRGTVRQEMFNRAAVSLVAGYQNSDYDETDPTVSTDRNDDYFYVGPAFDYSITERWTVGVFYQYRENASNDPSFEFENNQAGLRTAYRF